MHKIEKYHYQLCRLSYNKQIFIEIFCNECGKKLWKRLNLLKFIVKIMKNEKDLLILVLTKN